MKWITDLPAGILYSVVGIIAVFIIGVLGLAFTTILRGGKIKAGAVEIDGEPDDKPNEVVK